MRFSGKTAIVTGGASGIGEATVRKLAEEGANVVVAYSSNSAGADKLVAELASASGKVVAMKVNVTSEEDVKAMAEKTIKEFGKIDILVNNAGTVETYFKPHEMPTEVFDKTMNINARGVFLCCKYCIPSMIENKSGVIVFLASDEADYIHGVHLVVDGGCIIKEQ